MKRKDPGPGVDPLLWRIQALHTEALMITANMADLGSFMQRVYGFKVAQAIVRQVTAQIEKENEHERMVGPAGTDG